MSKGAAVTVGVIIAILIVAYIITMYVCYYKERWIFRPQYPQGPPAACYPLIQVTPLTQDQLANVQANVQKANSAS
jgi:hypothetical protein